MSAVALGERRPAVQGQLLWLVPQYSPLCDHRTLMLWETTSPQCGLYRWVGLTPRPGCGWAHDPALACESALLVLEWVLT